jgi:hypothetical protein
MRFLLDLRLLASSACTDLLKTSLTLSRQLKLGQLAHLAPQLSVLRYKIDDKKQFCAANFKLATTQTLSLKIDFETVRIVEFTFLK